MADYLPQNSGLWSTTTWITAFSNLTAFAGGNTPPTVIDDVYADGKTIYIDISTAVNTIRTTITPRTGGLAGGGFIINNGITLTANISTGTTTCLTFPSAAPNTCTITGTVRGSSTTANTLGVNNSSTGTVNIIGSVFGGIGAVSFLRAVGNNTTGTISITGNVTGGSLGNSSMGVFNNTTGIVNVIGNVIGGGTGTGVDNQGIYNNGGGVVNITGVLSGTAVVGVTNVSNGIVNIFGDVIGGTGAIGIVNSSTGTVNITGTSTGGSGSNVHGVSNTSIGSIYLYGMAVGGLNGGFGVNNTSTGLVYITRVKGNEFGLGSVGLGSTPGLANSQNGRAYVEQVEFGSRGQTPISGPVYIIPSNRNTLTGRLTALGNTVTFYNSLSIDGLLPPVSSVQAGVVYNVGNSTGTMAVPSASAVQFGVAVDNTTGTAALQPQDVWGYARLSATQIDSLGDRLRNVATTQSVGQQIASFNL